VPEKIPGPTVSRSSGLRFVVEKGSVALDGVSLTVASRRAQDFDVAVIRRPGA
jgi:riboflavin synthase alpha subunit